MDDAEIALIRGVIDAWNRRDLDAIFAVTVHSGISSPNAH